MFGTESGLKHAVLLDRKMGGGFCVRGEVATPDL